MKPAAAAGGIGAEGAGHEVLGLRAGGEGGGHIATVNTIIGTQYKPKAPPLNRPRVHFRNLSQTSPSARTHRSVALRRSALVKQNESAPLLSTLGRYVRCRRICVCRRRCTHALQGRNQWAKPDDAPPEVVARIIHAGQLPPSAEFAAYERAVPGAGGGVLEMAERTQDLDKYKLVIGLLTVWIICQGADWPVVLVRIATFSLGGITEQLP